MGDKITWTTEKRKLGDLKAWDKNPRQLSDHDAKNIKESMDMFGLADPLIVNTDNTIIGGHMRKRVIGDNGRMVDVRVPNRRLTDREVEELNIRLNRNSGEFDFDILANEFEIDDLLDWGFTEYDLEVGGFDMDEDPPEDPGAQVDKAEKLREKWQVESGQLWKLGEHRLICGDCTDAEVVERVMGGERAQSVICDPPFMVRSDKWDSFEGEQEFVQFIETWMDVGRNYADVVVSFMADHNVPLMLASAANIDFAFRRSLVWRKPPGSQFSGASLDGFWFDFEMINVFGTPQFKPSQETKMAVLEHRTVTGQEHGCEKPVELLEDLVGGYSEAGSLVIDLFNGTGTVMLACERLNRKCRGVEIEPKYVAVTLERWSQMTGDTPVLVE